MKHLLCIMMSLALVFSLAACTTHQDNAGSGDKKPQQNAGEESTSQKDASSQNKPFELHEFDSNHSAEDVITLEKTGYEMAGSKLCNLWFKFRNNSDWYLDQLHCNVQILDENGDALDSTSINFNDGLEPGQAAWLKYQDDSCRSSASIEELRTKLYALKITKIQVQSENMDGVDLYIQSPRTANFKFEKPIVVKVADIPAKQ